ncbi:hypothetical protein [Ilumatobacter sp.]|uniref:hypothetical protein n=1 Tax=Ilumatobacter sp. TaxID=1967498 RepID=UPI003C641EF1
MDSFEIRPATLDDVDAIEDYHARCFDKTYASQLLAGEIFAPGRAGMRKQFRDWFEPGSDVETESPTCM